MKYSRFELLVLVFGGGAIAATVAVALTGKADPVEAVAQLLLLFVLVGAAHFGRKGGFLAALIAMAIYLAMRIPTISASGGLTPSLAQLLLTRAGVYGVVGIVGGELCSRIKYFFLKLEGHDYIDDITHLYNQTYLRELLRSHIAQHARYQAVFSLITLHVDEAVLPPLSKANGRRVLKEVGNALLGDIRLVDEMGRLEGTTFLMVLPSTSVEGARVAAERLAKTATNTLRGNGIVPTDSTIEATALGYPEDKESVEDIAGAPAPQPTDAASG